MPRKKKRTYYADFETTNPDREGRVRVYSWAIVSGDEEYSGNVLYTFMQHLYKNGGLYFFHNLKFDFSYIHYYLIQNNIEYTMVERKGTYYSIKFWDVELRDSMNILNMSLAELGKCYNKVYQKTSIDYNVPYDHQCTEEERIYNINDCRVLEEGLNNFYQELIELLDEAGLEKTKKKLFKKITIAGISFEAFKESSMYEKACPKTTPSQYKNWEDAYIGGFVYSNPLGIVESIRMLDENSMYPDKYSRCELPYGYPYRYTTWDEANKYNFYIARVYIQYELKSGYVPIIGKGFGKFGGANYSASSKGEFEEHTFSNIDLELIRRHYHCEIVLVWAYCFNTAPFFYKKYADTFIAFKNKYKGSKRNTAKVMLNSPYGKTGMNGSSEIKRWYIDEDTKTIKSEVIGYECEDTMYQYLPQAIAITAYARQDLLNTADKIGFPNIQYMDTDSIKYFDKIKPNIKTDPDKLGAWKDEGFCDLFKTIAPKKYCFWIKEGKVKLNKELRKLRNCKYMEYGKIEFTCAGFNKKVLASEMQHKKYVSRETALNLMNKFDIGLKLKCNQSKVCIGGRAILSVSKEIK